MNPTEGIRSGLRALILTVLMICANAVAGQGEAAKVRPASRSAGAAPTTSKYQFDPSTLKPFTVVERYLDKYETGLYPDGKNEMPEAHRKAGERIAAAIRPLDTAGKPDDTSGRIIALALGHSNTREYFRAMEDHVKKNSADLHARFELLNAAVGGQMLPQMLGLREQGLDARGGPRGVWDHAKMLLSRQSYSAAQVQVLFLHTTWYGATNARKEPPGEFPRTMQQMQQGLARVLKHCLALYPNLRIAYLTCDGFRHYGGYEPHVWQEAFAFKWLIESQIKGEAGTEFDGDDRKLPWLSWGPYFWDNTWDRSYFTDGVHPSRKGMDIFVDKYWKHLQADSVARMWLLRPRPETAPGTSSRPQSKERMSTCE